MIAADAGLISVRASGIEPNLVVGDFDSLGRLPDGISYIRHPVMKDETDMLLAVKAGEERGYKKFLIFGGLGGRTDHTFANIQTLCYISEHGGAGCLIGKGEAMTVFSDNILKFDNSFTGTVSVFAYGGIAYGVTLNGMKYPLNEATLVPSFPIGVSNEFVADGSVTVKKGSLLVMWQSRHYAFPEGV
ncbi:Thiamine pyrophosphokinase [bioreactor metagenome]|uniref:Thiamine pyrophosphokinase n=1 Tax=bioreactor metagenome TaxID=1076179 RepID=A0A645HXC9_9ZZZZ